MVANPLNSIAEIVEVMDCDFGAILRQVHSLKYLTILGYIKSVCIRAIVTHLARTLNVLHLLAEHVLPHGLDEPCSSLLQHLSKSLDKPWKSLLEFRQLPTQYYSDGHDDDIYLNEAPPELLCDESCSIFVPESLLKHAHEIYCRDTD